MCVWNVLCMEEYVCLYEVCVYEYICVTVGDVCVWGVMCVGRDVCGECVCMGVCVNMSMHVCMYGEI